MSRPPDVVAPPVTPPTTVGVPVTRGRSTVRASAHPATARPSPTGRAADTSSRRWFVITRRVVLAVLLAALLRVAVVDSIVIDGPGMNPAPAPGDRALAVRTTLGITSVDRGDAVLITPPADWLPTAAPIDGTQRVASFLLGRRTSATATLRVIGMPGDTVRSGTDGIVLVNGVPLDESTYVRRIPMATYVPFEVVVPLGRLWLMSDDRLAGGGSPTYIDRTWSGTVPVDNVRGVVRLVYWPLSHLRPVTAPEGISTR